MTTSTDTLTMDLAGMLRRLDSQPGYHAESYPKPGDDTGVIRIGGRDYVLTLQPARPAPDPEARHNHDPNPFGRYQPAGECPRCDQLRSGGRAGAPAPTTTRSAPPRSARMTAAPRDAPSSAPSASGKGSPHDQRAAAIAARPVPGQGETTEGVNR